MALSPKLQLRQSQSLVMTPQLMQAIKLLQLSNLDLAAYVESELEKNPLLERAGSDDGPDEGAGAAAPSNTDELDTTLSEPDLNVLARDLDAEPADSYEPDAAATPEPAAPPADPGPSLRWDVARGGGGGDEGFDAFAQISAPETLSGHLEGQLAVSVDDPVDRLIGQYLIDQIDEAGYFRGTIEDVADRLGVSHDRVAAVLDVLQTFDPTGVMARDLAECLALQLREKDRYDPAMQALVENLEKLARRDLASLRRICGVDDEDLTDMIREIRELEPKPGRAFGDAPIRTVVPDVIVTHAPNGGWRIELNTETLPRVLVNERYTTTVTRSGDADAKAYLSTCLQDANWLVKSLDQRARTIIRVAEEIVRQQDGFLTHGVTHLKPLNLKSIAERIDMHESTVSRVTSNKFISTPRGLYEFRYFFTNAIAATEGGEAHSAETVRMRIRSMIEDEPAAAVLSDDQIVQALRRDGIDIARRTVAKYRESLGIPSSVQRRREKLVAI